MHLHDTLFCRGEGLPMEKLMGRPGALLSFSKKRPNNSLYRISRRLGESFPLSNTSTGSESDWSSPSGLVLIWTLQLFDKFPIVLAERGAESRWVRWGNKYPYLDSPVGTTKVDRDL